MATPPPYLQPIPGYPTGYTVAQPFPAYYPPAPVQRKSAAVTIIKVVAGVAIAGAAYYVGAKVAQSQQWNLGCPSGQVGLPFICAPGSGPPPSNCGACSSSCLDGTCPSGQVCGANGKAGVCGTPSAPQYPGQWKGPTTIDLYAQICQPVTASLTSGCGVAPCGSPIVCSGTGNVRIVLLDSSPQHLPIANANITVANSYASQVITDSQSYITDANGAFVVNLTTLNEPTFACNWSPTTTAAISFSDIVGGPVFTLVVNLHYLYKTNEGALGTCGGCSSCTG